MAGQNDARGPLLDFINQLLIKKIFNMAKQVRMIIVITHEQIKSSRGQCVREQMELVLKIVQGNIDKAINSIIPIITKVVPVQQGEETEFDLDAIKKDLYDVFDQWLNNYCKEKNLPQNRITLIDSLVDEVIES